MSSRITVVGLAILVAGAMIGIVGVSRPLTSVSQQQVTLVNAALAVDPNDYASQSLVMATGQSVQVTLRVSNQTIFTFDIMNQSQYDVWYNCAPRCHQPLLGGSGTYYQQANETDPTLVNATVTPSAPYMAPFTAPSNATYYFVLDNSIGSTWSSYLNQDASGSTMAQLTLTSMQAVTEYEANWLVVGLGLVVILVGGAIATWLGTPRGHSVSRSENLRET